MLATVLEAIAAGLTLFTDGLQRQYSSGCDPSGHITSGQACGGAGRATAHAPVKLPPPRPATGAAALPPAGACAVASNRTSRPHPRITCLAFIFFVPLSLLTERPFG
jgi:hypothetical protein